MLILKKAAQGSFFRGVLCCLFVLLFIEKIIMLLTVLCLFYAKMIVGFLSCETDNFREQIFVFLHDAEA